MHVAKEELVEILGVIADAISANDAESVRHLAWSLARELKSEQR